MRTYTSSSTEVRTADATDLADDVTPDIRDEMVLYRENLDQFLLLNEQQNSRRNRSLIAIVALCLLCYARSEKSNIFQAVTGHAAFAHNIPKRAVETFHQMGLLVSYESIRRALTSNAGAVEAQLREKVQKYRFFISYDNMNFYEHVRDARMSNRGAQINYSAGYICFIKPTDGVSNPRWQNQYLSASLVDHTEVKYLRADDFILSSSDLRHQGAAVQHTISQVLGRYFATAMRKQKIEVNGKHVRCLRLVSIG